MFPVKVLAGLLAFGLSQTVLAKVDLKLEGQVTQGGLLVGSTTPGNQVFVDNAAIKVSRQGLFTLGFSRDTKKTYDLKIIAKDGEILHQYLTPAKREFRIQHIEGISKKIMEPDPEALKRIKKDSIQIRAARAIASDNIDFAHGFKAPSQGRITGVYGSQRFYNGIPKNPHFGLDFAGPEGTDVNAPAAGVITLWVPDMFYSGGTLVIDHGHGITSTFLHLSGTSVQVGDRVLQGQAIAQIGTTGRSTGPHLDWRVNWHDVRIDPALTLELPNMQKFNDE